MKRVLATAVMSAAVFTFAFVPVVLADNSRLAAHRADNSRFPQNTVAAIKSAVREGAGIIEIDVRRCKTGELMVICEPDLAETTDGTGTVAQATFEYLRSISACAQKKFGDRFKGKFKIPTLEEAFDAIPKDGPYINCHCTDGTHRETAELIMKQNRQNRAYIGVLGYQVKRLKRDFPEVMLCNMQRPGMSKGVWTKEQHWNYAKETVEWGCSFVQPIGVKNVPPPEVVDYLHKHGVKVVYFKCDDPEERKRIFFENDVDFIFTDRLPANKTGSDFCWNGHFEELRGEKAYGWRTVNGFVFRRGAGRDGSGGAELLKHDVKKPAYIANEFHIRGGRSYEVSAWIRTEDVRGSKSGAMVYAEVKDSDGKYMEGAEIYPRGSVGTRGWTRYGGVVNAPFSAEKIEAGVMLFAGAEGKVRVDDFSCVLLPDVPVKSVVCDAYRNCTERGRLNVSALLGQEVSERKGYSGFFSLMNREGKKVLTAASSIGVERATAQMDLTKCAAGKYSVEFVLKDGNGKIAGRKGFPLEIADRLPPRKVAIDSCLRTMVDGKPFFPLGMYSYDIDASDIDRYVEAPFNCIMSYRVPSNEQMDYFQRKGIRAIIGFSNYFYTLAKQFESIDDEYDFYTNSINRLKDHPSTLAWYLHDEIPLSFMPRLLERQRLAHLLDPEHPTWGVLCLPYNTGLFLDTFDICGNDPYPVYHDGRKDLSKSWKWARLSRQLSFSSRGIWQVPQAFSWGNYQKLAEAKCESRLPTYEEMRNMAYQQIAGGANGLIFYSFHDVQKTFKTNPQEGARHWENVKRLIRELRGHEKIYLSADKGAPLIAEPEKIMLSVRTWRMGGKDYILVSSGESREVKYTFSLPRVYRKLKSLSGTCSLGPEGNCLQVRLAPYGMVLAELSVLHLPLSSSKTTKE